MTEVDCPECDGKHENMSDCACHACYDDAVEVGIHRPVLCLECTKALNMIREELNPCPNCGSSHMKTLNQSSYRCTNRNCRVKEFKGERDVEVYQKVLEKRIEDDDLENPPKEASIEIGVFTS